MFGQPPKLKYRPEIDGLRAIAVLAVIFAHAKFSQFKGGFIGVDMFFVISGYLITTIILQEKFAGTFSLIKFYERRARRILPALFLVMFCCLPFAWFLMMPYQFNEFAKSMIMVVLFVSNFLFWKTSGYFDSASAEKPLLHTWSLGVEEQFYVLFPLFISLAWGLGFKRLRNIIVVIALISLLFSEWLWSHGHDMMNFFLAPSRAWELMVGAILAFLILYKPLYERTNQLTNNLLSALGLFLICYSITCFSPKTPSPSVYCLLPTIGTALVIAFASKETLVARLLSLRLIAGIGLVSYSAYLWHQPLFAFAHVSGHSSKMTMNIFILVSLVLAYLSWRFIEKPFRDKKKISSKQILWFAIMGSLFFVILGAIIGLTRGFESRFSEQWNRWANNKLTARYVNKKALSLQKDFTKTNKRKILIIGDSFSKDFVNGIFENEYLVNDEIRTFGVPSICQIYWGDDNLQPFIKPVDSKLCRGFHRRLQETSRIKDADIVILAASWRTWAAKRLPTTIQNLNLKPSQQLFVVGRKHFGEVHLHPLMSVPIAERLSLRNSVLKSHLQTNTLMAKTLPASYFVNQHYIICGDSDRCPLFTPDDELITHDGNHLTQEGAKYVGKLLFENSQLKTLLK